MVDEDVKNMDTADQAADSETEATTLAAIESKMAEMRNEDEPVEDNDVSSDAEDVKTDQTDTEDQKDVDSDKKDDDSPILPSGHRRAALARGYTNEEIDHYLETKPDEAAVRFGELYDERRVESSQWSERGRLLVDAEQKATRGDEDGDKETQDVIPHYDAKALIEEHGNEDLVNALVNPLNTVIDRVNAATERLSSSEKFLRGTKENALLIATQDFLKSKEMEPYKEAYGVEIKDVTKEQMESRMQLFAEADIITAGAVAHGQEITVQDALERAFAIVSQGTRDEGIRQEIRDSIKKRTKTTKSSHQQTSVSDENQEISEKELEKRTDARLRALRDKR